MQNARPEEQSEYEYAGFWVRTGACLVDSLIFSLILLPVTIFFYGTDYFWSDRFFRGPVDVAINWIVPAILTVVLWRWFQATPGKMALRLRVLDAESGYPALFIRNGTVRGFCCCFRAGYPDVKRTESNMKEQQVVRFPDAENATSG